MASNGNLKVEEKIIKDITTGKKEPFTGPKMFILKTLQ